MLKRWWWAAHARWFKPRELRRRADAFARNWRTPVLPRGELDPANPFRAFTNARASGRGIWKWDHYFDIYERHFSRFRSRPVTLLEIGVYSGGSLDLWRSYFGPDAHIIGVDIEESVRVYERDGIRILIGDQADRSFWARVLPTLPPLDIVIDDGGHTPEQMIVTLEATLPRLAPGGVYLCEDICGTAHLFHDYVHGLARALHAVRHAAEPGRESRSINTAFQAEISSIHQYPFVTVIELRTHAQPVLFGSKRGTEWQPFL
jgi:hypothetical protein